MTTTNASKRFIILLWICRVLLAVFMLLGAILKLMPIEKLSAMMPWAGQVPLYVVHLLALVDLAGAFGLLLPGVLNYKPVLIRYAAGGIALLMLCAIVFHISRGETAVTGGNIIALLIALFIAWGQTRTQS